MKMQRTEKPERCEIHDCELEYRVDFDRYICPLCFTKQPKETSISNELVEKYDDVYQSGEEKFWTFLPIEERLCILKHVDFTGKNVLEIGCGTGDFSAWMATAGAKLVTGMDASPQAIGRAMVKYDIPNLIFTNGQIGDENLLSSNFRYDVVVMVGVLEHTIDPGRILRLVSDDLMGLNGLLVSSSPSFNNPRGFIWLALQELMGLPMSLTDKWVITPRDMKSMAKEAGMEVSKYFDVDYSWANGERFLQDFRQRLPKVFKNTNVEQGKIDRFMKLVEKLGPFSGEGANTVYFMTKAG
jgi:2-polyprenyl-3-methyl-5-hydroxy-6-metoxy-1,4-benzoquinol methylase